MLLQYGHYGDVRHLIDHWRRLFISSYTLKSRQTVERTVSRVEAEGEDGRVVVVGDVHAPSACERAQLTDVADRHRHVALGAANREVVLVAILARLSGQVKLDAGERELERDAPVVDGALSLNRKSWRGHGHAQIHRGEPAVWRRCRVISAWRRHRANGKTVQFSTRLRWHSPLLMFV